MLREFCDIPLKLLGRSLLTSVMLPYVNIMFAVIATLAFVPAFEAISNIQNEKMHCPF